MSKKTLPLFALAAAAIVVPLVALVEFSVPPLGPKPFSFLTSNQLTCMASAGGVDPNSLVRIGKLSKHKPEPIVGMFAGRMKEDGHPVRVMEASRSYALQDKKTGLVIAVGDPGVIIEDELTGSSTSFTLTSAGTLAAEKIYAISGRGVEIFLRRPVGVPARCFTLS